MNGTIPPLLVTLLLLLALACQRSGTELGQLVDERIAAALAAVPTITPQPTATLQKTAAPQATVLPQAAALPQPGSIEKIEATIESLMGRLTIAESELKAQYKEFRDLINALDDSEADAISTVPLSGSVVTAVIESISPSGRCWQYRLAAAGTGNTLLVEWRVLENIDSLCFNPSSSCATEVAIGAPLPASCVKG